MSASFPNSASTSHFRLNSLDLQGKRTGVVAPFEIAQVNYHKLQVHVNKELSGDYAAKILAASRIRLVRGVTGVTQ
jgi:hypothetical protein